MFRSALVKYAALAILVGGGATGGLYLSGGWPGGSAAPTSANDPAPPPAPAIADAAPPQQPYRFPLSALDAKDTAEAPDLAAGVDGAVFLTWASKTGAAERTVFFTRSNDSGRSFSTPKAVSKGGIYRTPAKGGGKSGGFERRATPHLALTPTGLHLAWGEGRPDGSGMKLVLATSTDAGTTFGLPAPVHSGNDANPTFTSFAVSPNGALACAWLDDRAGTQQVFASLRPSGTQTFEAEKLVHAGQPDVGVCPCCPTAACFGPGGTLYVAFRNVKDGYRDIAIGRRKPEQDQFDGPFLVVTDTWKFDGCPHDGPALAVVGDTIHVVWMDARSGGQRCYYARAKAGDKKFEARELHLGVPGTQGNAKLFADIAGNLHAVWEESLGAAMSEGNHATHQHGPPKVGVGGGRAVMYAVMPEGRSEFGAARAVAPKPGAFQTRPTITGSPNGNLFVAWMELDTDGKAVIVTRLPASTEGGRP